MESPIELLRLLEVSSDSVQVLHDYYWFRKLFSVGDYLISCYVELLVCLTSLLSSRLLNLLQKLLS